MRRRDGITVEEFEKALDEFFDEMLIARWRGGAPQAGDFERSRVIDRSAEYEVRLEIPGADPAQIEVDVVGQRLHVRVACGGEGCLERSYSFAQKIDQDKVAARWADDTLVVTLPKHKPRQIRIEQG